MSFNPHSASKQSDFQSSRLNQNQLSKFEQQDDFMSNADMSVCEQSFHFASTKDGAIGGQSKLMIPNSETSSQFNETAPLGMDGNKQNSMLFANLDAKTVSQPGGIQERNLLLGEIGPGPGENNETKMSENEAFLAYCQQDNDEEDAD